MFVGVLNQQGFKQLAAQFYACERGENAEQQVRIGRFAKTSQDDQLKIILAVRTLGEKTFTLLDGLRQAGGRCGSAPAGYVKEEL